MSGPLKKYRVMRNGFETVMKLSDADAAKLGAGPYQVSDAVSTIEPVTAVGGSGGEDDDGTPDSATAAMADAGAAVSGELAAGLPATGPVQPPSEPGGDGQAAGDAPAPGGDPGDGDGQAAAVEPVKTLAKKRAPAANKARTAAENKAADSGSS